MRIWLSVLGLGAGLFGAAGVGLAAVGAHHSGNPIVTTAAYFLLFHAAALVGLAAVAHHGRQERALLAGSSLIAVGVVLFSGDLALRGLAGIVLVHVAAPTGGVLMIAGWLVVAMALPVTLRHAKAPSSG